MDWAGLIEPGIVVVSGKGGTGKSTIAAALALAAATRGRRVLLAEVEGRREVTRTLGVEDPGFAERPTPWGFHILSITPHETVREYLRRYAGMRRLPQALLRARTIDLVVPAVPGLRDLLALGLIYEILEVRPHDAERGDAPRYDLVVIDGPPTGQVAAFLQAPTTFADLVRMGRVRRQSAAVADLLRRRARVAVVAVPEEMSVAETLEAVPEIRGAGVRHVTVVANRLTRDEAPGVSDGVPGPEEAMVIAARAGVELSPQAVEHALVALAAARRRRRFEDGRVRELRKAGAVLRLPDLSGSPDGSPVFELAGLIAGGHVPAGPRPTPAARAPGPSPQLTTLGDRLAGTRVVVVCGSGGCGKTTISAATAVHLAGSGRRTVLLTVDPARRLATALRLPMVPGERTTVGIGGGRSFDAIQLDTKRTFDELIERFARTREQRDRILFNPIYRRIADTLSGTHEYMAMEKLHQLAEETDFEAIVVDTPPTRSALAFLDAPRRLSDFLGGRFLRGLLTPSVQAGRATFNVARWGATAFVRTVGRLLGAEVVEDLVDFLNAFQGMYAGFKERAGKVVELLALPQSTFVVVTTPVAPSVDEAGFFLSRLEGGGMRLAAVVANRWHREDRILPPEAEKAVEALAGGGPEERALAAAIAERLRQERRAEREAALVGAFAAAHPGTPIVAVPELERDVQDVAGLRAVADHLFG